MSKKCRLGLWAPPGGGNINISRLNPDTLAVLQNWVVPRVKYSTGRAFTRSTSGRFFVGDRSRLIRFRRNAKGGLDAGEIDGKDVLATLAKGGATVPYDNLFELKRLQVDPATGGLLAVETRNAQVLVIVPKE